jgi:hypothetical protein
MRTHSHELSSREWTTPDAWFRGDGSAAAITLERSDFSPGFWLAGAPGGKSPPGAGALERIPLSYPLLVALVLIFTFLMQRNFT